LDNPELARARIKRDLRRQAEPLGFALAPVGGEVSQNTKNYRSSIDSFGTATSVVRKVLEMLDESFVFE